MTGDIMVTIGSLVLAIGLLAVLCNLFILPSGKLPTRDEERTSPPEDMLRRYKVYIRRTAICAIIYTVTSVTAWKLQAVPAIVVVLVVGALLAWVVLAGVSMERASMKRRLYEGTYGMTREELRQHLRKRSV